jgi:protein-disulfide isomerase
MTAWRWTVPGLLLGLLAAGLAGFVGGRMSSAPDRGTTERIVRDYLLAHPEILPMAMDRLQAQDSARAIAAARGQLEAPFASAWAGNPAGDVTLVMFSDYSCGYCKASVPAVERLLHEDPALKVVWREIPVLGPQSELAARAGLAAAKQGRYLVFHRALFQGGHPDMPAIAAAARKSGIDRARLDRDLQDGDIAREIDANLTLANRLGINGTPAFVIGNRVLAGAVGYDALKKAIAETRAG